MASPSPALQHPAAGLDAGLLATIATATDDVIFAKDAAGRYTYANPATLRHLGRELAQVIGRTDADLVGEGPAARRRQSDEQVMASGETVEVEEPVPAADGAVTLLLVRKMPLRDASGRVNGLLGIGRDITQRMAAQARAESDRLKLRMAIQAAGLVTAEIDYRHNQNHISAELAQLMELGDETMVVPRQAIFDRIHPDDRQRYVDAIARTIDPAGNGHLAIDVRALMPSGVEKWLHIVLQVTFSMQDGQLRPDRGICAAADITDRMLAEKRKDAFIATLAHELRNPLAPVRNGLEILKRTADPAATQKVRDMMERQLLHLVRLVDDLLDVSRITADKLELRLAPLTLQQVVDHALESSEPLVQARQHALRVTLPPRPVPLQADLTRLAQVLSNLLNNAAKYTPPGGHIDLVATVERDELVIDVQDDGNGIPPDVLPRLFGLFTQSDGTRDLAQGGLGIGLWLVKKLVALHGGSVEAHSDGVRGSRFRVRLPLT